MKQFLFLFAVLFSIQSLYSQLPCETECCPNGPQHIFDGLSGPLPTTGSTGPSWIAIDGSPYYNPEDGCDTPSSLALPPIGFSGTSEASFSETGFGGPIPQFLEGQSYCFQICTKNQSGFAGSLELYADNTLIQNTSTIINSDGWVTDEFFWTSNGTYTTFNIINNNSSPVNGALEILADDICYTESTGDESCEAAFIIEETECGEYCFIDQSCGEYSLPFWTITGPGLPSGGVNIEEENPCYTFPQSGSYTVQLTIFCDDGTTSSTFMQFDADVPTPPSFDCPVDNSVIATNSDCVYEYEILSLNLQFGTAQCTIENITTNSGPVAIFEGDFVLLDPGVHQIICSITSECFEVEQCIYTIEVICESSDTCIEDFEEYATTPLGNSVGNWTTSNCQVAYQVDGNTNGTNVLVGADGSGSSFMGNLVDFQGDWIADYQSCDFCFDIRYDNGNPANPATGTSAIFIYENGPPNNIVPSNTNFARFNVSTPIGNAWTRVCVPVSLSDGVNLPSNAEGSWNVATPAQFDQLIQNVDGISFSIDFAGGSNQSERLYIDNLCFEDCPRYDVDCDSLMVMANEVENLCIDPELADPDLICTTEYDPVCGCNGQTYGNACEAQRDGVTTTIPGECNGNNTPVVEDDCCHSIDLKNNWGQDIVEIEVDILDPNWIFNTVSLDPAFNLGSCGSLNQKLCVSHLSGSIPTGTTSDVFDVCFASLITNPTTNPSIEIKWKQVVNELDTAIVCRDTLVFECMPPPSPDTCLVVTNQEIDCDPEDPSSYNYCFDVTNLSGVDVGQITLECLDPGFFFNPPFNLNSHIEIPTPNPLPNGQSTQICIDIYASISIISSQDVCMKLGLISADGKECCHTPVKTCVEIDPCCDPCELKDVLATSISMNEEECCYSIGLENLCEIPYFTKFEAEVVTPGVCFGSHVIDPAQSANWNQNSTARNICLSPIGSGYIDQVSYSGLLDFCLDKIDDVSQRNPEVVFRWYAYDPITNSELVMCTDTLVTECMEPDNNICLEVFDQDLECVQDSSKYRYTFTVVNHSNPAFTADRLLLTIKNDPTNFIVGSPGPIIPISPSLDSGDTMTFSTCIIPTSFPATIPNLVFGYRLQNSQTGDCCFESTCDTIMIPQCPVDPDECCTDSLAFCNLVDLGFQVVNQGDCSITIDATQFDTCHWFGTPEPDWGDGTLGINVITSAVGAGPWTHTYTQSGVYNICVTVYEGNDVDDFCWDKQICTEVVVECSTDTGCCDDYEEFCNLVDQGFQIIVNQDCSVNIDAIQFDECHWFKTPSPDWGDGSIIFPLPTPAVGAGSWTHTYTQSGTYNICIDVFEGDDEDNICWEKQMCTEVTVECDVEPECCDDFEAFCDLVDLGFSVINNEDCSVTIDATQFDSCHWYGTPVPDWDDGSVSTQVITPAVGAGPWTYTYTQSGTYNICITVFEGDDVDDFCWDKQMCVEVEVDCGCEPDTSCFAVNNIESKEIACDVDDCYAEPFCLPWLTTLMDNSTTNGCQLIVDYSVFHRAIWNGQTVFVGYKNGAPDGGSQDIYNCDGDLIQSCTQGVGPVVCSPDANIDINSDLRAFNAFWNCGDIIPDEADCGIISCMDYDDPYCSEWVVSLITDTNLLGCPTTSTYSFFKARINGQVVLIQEELGVPNIDRTTIYDCRGIVMQSCLISGPGMETCTIDAGINVNTDVSDQVSLWTCGDQSPTLSANCTTTNVCVDYCFDVTNTTNPAKPLDRIDINGAAGLSPRVINLIPALMVGQTRSISVTLCGDYLPSDIISLDLMASDTCCTESIPISLDVPECPVDSMSCCTDSLQFCNLVDLGFQVINNDDCSITIDATQFDTCHWYETPAPDWGDGSRIVKWINKWLFL